MENELAIRDGETGKPLVAESLKQTCFACPSQWEGKLEDGRMFYARFRWGYLSVRVSEGVTNNAMDAVSGSEIFGGSVEDEWAGCMSTSEMAKAVRGVLEIPMYAEDANEIEE